MMSMGARSKVASMSHSLLSSDPSESGDSVEQIGHSNSYSEDRNNTSAKQNQFSQSTADYSGKTSNVLSDSRYVILKTSCGLLYPVPRSIRSPQIENFQTGLRSLTLFNFLSAIDIAQWFDKFLEQCNVNKHA